MNTTRAHRLLGIIAGLMLGSVVSLPTWAAFGGSPAQAFKGTVQSVDYLHHAITVNGQTYAVAENATFSGVASFSVLHIGMPIAYTLGDATQTQGPGATPPSGPAAAQTENAAAPVITSITWLPGGV